MIVHIITTGVFDSIDNFQFKNPYTNAYFKYFEKFYIADELKQAKLLRCTDTIGRPGIDNLYVRNKILNQSLFEQIGNSQKMITAGMSLLPTYAYLLERSFCGTAANVMSPILTALFSNFPSLSSIPRLSAKPSSYSSLSLALRNIPRYFLGDADAVDQGQPPQEAALLAEAEATSSQALVDVHSDIIYNTLNAISPYYEAMPAYKYEFLCHLTYTRGLYINFILLSAGLDQLVPRAEILQVAYSLTQYRQSKGNRGLMLYNPGWKNALFGPPANWPAPGSTVQVGGSARYLEVL